MTPIETAIFAVLWFGLVPPSAALLAEDITQERIGTTLTAWVDRRFRGTLVAYLFRCKRCLSHWIVALAALLLGRCWTRLPLEMVELQVLVVVFSVLAAIRITRAWLLP